MKQRIQILVNTKQRNTSEKIVVLKGNKVEVVREEGGGMLEADEPKRDRRF